MFLYENKFGHAGTDHSVKLQFEVCGNAVFPTRYNKDATKTTMPWYEIRNNQVFQTAFHPSGHSLLPTYEVRGNAFHNTSYHPDGIQPHASFHLR